MCGFEAMSSYMENIPNFFCHILAQNKRIKKGKFTRGYGSSNSKTS